MNEREQRIVATALSLAQEGGFEAVRLRDVAAHASVALGTVYRYFPRGKDDILVPALSHEFRLLVSHMAEHPPTGATVLERVTAYFDAATRSLCGKPKLARAVLRAASSDDPELAGKIRTFHGAASDLLMAAIRSDSRVTLADATPREARVCNMLQMVWFAAMLGWMSAQYKQEEVVELVRDAAELALG